DRQRGIPRRRCAGAHEYRQYPCKRALDPPPSATHARFTPYWASPPNASFCSKTTDACGGGRRPHVPIGPKVSIAPGADCHLFASPPIFADGNRLVFGEG